MFSSNTDLVKGGTFETFVEDVSFWMENKLLESIDGDIDDEIQRFLAFIPYMVVNLYKEAPMVSTFYTYAIKSSSGVTYRCIDTLDIDVENVYDNIDEVDAGRYDWREFDQYRMFEDYYRCITGCDPDDRQTMFMCVLSCCTIAILNKAKLNAKFDELPEDEKKKFALVPAVKAIFMADFKKKILDKLAKSSNSSTAFHSIETALRNRY